MRDTCSGDRGDDPARQCMARQSVQHHMTLSLDEEFCTEKSREEFCREDVIDRSAHNRLRCL